MGYIVTIILFMIALITYKSTKNLSSPILFFCLEWAFICFLASLRLFTLYDVSIKTWLIILFGSITFVVACVFGSKIKINKNHAYKPFEFKKPGNFILSDTFIKQKTLWIMIGLLFIFTIPSFVQTIEYLKLGYTLGQIRDASVGQMEIQGYIRQTGITSEILTLLKNLIEIFTVATCIVYTIEDYKKNYKLFFAIFAFELFNSLTSGSRFNLAYFILELIVCLFIYKKNGLFIGFKYSRKTKRMIKRIIIVLIVFVVIITLMRGAETSELLKKYYRYICGNVAFFDIHVYQIDQIGYYSFPYAGLYGFFSILLPLFNKIGFEYPNRYLKTLGIVFDTQTFRRVGDKLMTNAFITPFYHLYADGRFLGVFIGMSFIGILTGYLYKKMMNSMKQKDIVNYLIIVQMLFKTLQTYPLTSELYFVTLIMMFILRKY